MLPATWPPRPSPNPYQQHRAPPCPLNSFVPCRARGQALRLWALTAKRGSPARQRLSARQPCPPPNVALLYEAMIAIMPSIIGAPCSDQRRRPGSARSSSGHLLGVAARSATGIQDSAPLSGPRRWPHVFIQGTRQPGRRSPFHSTSHPRRKMHVCLARGWERRRITTR